MDSVLVVSHAMFCVAISMLTFPESAPFHTCTKAINFTIMGHYKLLIKVVYRKYFL